MSFSCWAVHQAISAGLMCWFCSRANNVGVPGAAVYRGAGGECILRLGVESIEIDEQRRYGEPGFRKLKQLKHTGR